MKELRTRRCVLRSPIWSGITPDYLARMTSSSPRKLILLKNYYLLLFMAALVLAVSLVTGAPAQQESATAAPVSEQLKNLQVSAARVIQPKQAMPPRSSLYKPRRHGLLSLLTVRSRGTPCQARTQSSVYSYCFALLILILGPVAILRTPADISPCKNAGFCSCGSVGTGTTSCSSQTVRAFHSARFLGDKASYLT